MQNKEEILLRRIEELEREVKQLEEQLRFEKSKALQVTPKVYPFWHEADRRTNSTYTAIDLHNLQSDFNNDNGY